MTVDLIVMTILVTDHYISSHHLDRNLTIVYEVIPFRLLNLGISRSFNQGFT